MNEESRADTFRRVASSSASASENASDFMNNWEGVDYKESERIEQANAWLSTIQNELGKV